jgi:hypothetical protein
MWIVGLVRFLSVRLVCGRVVEAVEVRGFASLSTIDIVAVLVFTFSVTWMRSVFHGLFAPLWPMPGRVVGGLSAQDSFRSLLLCDALGNPVPTAHVTSVIGGENI